MFIHTVHNTVVCVCVCVCVYVMCVCICVISIGYCVGVGCGYCWAIILCRQFALVAFATYSEPRLHLGLGAELHLTMLGPRLSWLCV